MGVAAPIAAQLSHGEVLEDPLLHLVQAVVPVIERLLNLLERHPRDFGARRPGEREYPLDPVPEYLVLTRRTREGAQALDLASCLRRDLLGHLRGLEPADQFGGLSLAGIALPEFGADRLQLLPKEELAVMAVHAPLGLLAHLLAHLRLRRLALPALGHELQPREHVEALHDLVLLGGAQPAASGGEVGEA